MSKKFIVVSAIIAGAGLLAFSSPVMAQDQNPREILEKTLDRNYQDLSMAVKLVKVSKKGREREMELEVKIKKSPEVTKTLAVFTAPPEVAGITSLSWDYPDPAQPSDRWFKLSGLDFVKCMGSACQKMEDRFGFSMEIFAIKLDEANHKLLGEEDVDGAACYKIESTSKDQSNPKGARFITWVDKDKYVARKIEAYNSAGEKTQESKFTEFKKLGDHWWETKGELTQYDTGKSLRFEIKDAKVNTGIPDEIFDKPKTFKVEE